MRRVTCAIVCAVALTVAPLWAALPFSDNFTTDNFATLWTVINGAWTTNGGEADPQGAANNVAKVTSETFANDHYAQAKLRSTSYPGICVRVAGTSLATFDGYCVLRRVLEGNTAIYRADDGTLTQLGADFGAATNTTDIRLSVTGTTLTLLFDGVSQGTRSDGNYGSGTVAAYSFDASGTLDDFSADNISSAPACTGGLSLLGVGGC